MLNIIDHGTGNITSIKNFLDSVKVQHQLATNTNNLKNASHIIIPGVGHFRAAMNKLRTLEMDKAIFDAAMHGVPILGICLGMHILYEFSEEGMSEGLGLMKGQVVKKKPSNPNLHKVPNVGWLSVERIMDSCLFNNIAKKESIFYFANLFAVENKHQNSNTSIYNFDNDYIASSEKKNIYCTQFHPEKSGVVGHTLIKNFLNLKIHK